MDANTETLIEEMYTTGSCPDCGIGPYDEAHSGDCVVLAGLKEREFKQWLADTYGEGEES